MRPNPTPEQAKVLESQSKALLVAASAGVGKTFVLVERYLGLVTERGLSPERILTITFTRKAAAEMKARIVRRLRVAGLREESRRAETGPIQTIHSFCEGLLRERAIHAGIDPEFEVLESDVQPLLILAARRALASPPSELPNVADLLQSIAQTPTRRDTDEVLLKRIQDAVQRLRSSGITHEFYEQNTRTPDAMRLSLERAMLDRLPPQALAKFHEESGSFSESYVAATKGLRFPFKANDRWWESVQTSLPATAGFGQVVSRTWAVFEELLVERQGLDFAGLESRAVRLAEDGRLGTVPFDAILVDEAQDLNPLQHRLIHALKVPEQMLVGDEKQSIYGFRQAAPHIFREKQKEGDCLYLTQNRRSVPGILSFVDTLFLETWADLKYEPMLAKKALDLDAPDTKDFTGLEIWKTDRDVWITATADYVRELIDEGTDPHDIAILTRNRMAGPQLKKALEERKVMARIQGGSDQYYTRMEVRDLANTLRAAVDPNDTFALLCCLRSPVVGLSLDSIVLLAQAESPYKALQTFEPPRMDDREKIDRFLGWFERYTECADRLTAWEGIAQILASSPYLETLATRRDRAQRLANVRKLQQIAIQHPELGPREFAERVREIQALRHEEGDAPAHDEGQFVTILTIHKSKGLEFPVVVLPETDKPLGKIPAETVFVEAEYALAGYQGLNKSLVEWMRWEASAREEEEALRLLYVALTRAKRRLCVSTYAPKGPKTFSSIVLKVAERHLDASIVWRERPM